MFSMTVFGQKEKNSLLSSSGSKCPQMTYTHTHVHQHAYSQWQNFMLGNAFNKPRIWSSGLGQTLETWVDANVVFCPPVFVFSARSPCTSARMFKINSSPIGWGRTNQRTNPFFFCQPPSPPLMKTNGSMLVCPLSPSLPVSASHVIHVSVEQSGKKSTGSWKLDDGVLCEGRHVSETRNWWGERACVSPGEEPN